MKPRDIHDAVRGQLAGEVLIAARSNGFDQNDVLTICRSRFDKHFAELSTDEMRALIGSLNDLKRNEFIVNRPKDAAKEEREDAARAAVAKGLAEQGRAQGIYARCPCGDCN